MVPLSFGGHDFRALAEGALYWPARSALLVADLHLEKASWYAARGQLLPPYDSEATLSALATLVARTGATEIWCLGDSFHDVGGCDRLSPDAQILLRGLTGATRWTWITGNHDPAILDRCGGEVAEEALVDGLVLRHEADPSELQPELSGHFHPKLRLKLRGRSVARRCFVGSARKVILPAFGALTGGLDADHPAIIRAIGGTGQAWIPVEDRLLRFPLAA
ncbi:metallophosphatase [Sphingomonas metalli]|uniref:Metallophosphatase n=1 Tax=Sphingomonas metalli TaxID=1779358 RepID=A0A916WRQ6_9SPHN|nr:ligase-associated DNA damage response endonuclease PdeM [Sphingomonas metalli]GGB24313.1 metallophosphatase [Sphingomonas metalli]